MTGAGKTIYVTDRAAWRAWLAQHHATAREVWLVYYKQHTGKPRIPYGDAVEEALCFGWIDGKVKRIDDQRYMQRYTPRRKRSAWSRLNRERAERMIAEERMTGAGLAAIAAAEESGAWEATYASRDPPETPPELEAALAADKRAHAFFATLAPSHRSQYIHWVASAKREATRQRRIAEVVRRAAEGRKPGM